jgi:hypothetical protein
LAVISASIISAITARPTVALIANKPSGAGPAIDTERHVQFIEQRSDPGGIVALDQTHRCYVFFVMVVFPVPPELFLAEHPAPCQEEVSGGGPPTSLQQHPGQLHDSKAD